MSALTAARKTLQMGTPPEAIPGELDILLKANAKPFVGGVVAVDSTGYGVAGTAATALFCVGLLKPKAGYPQQYDNTGGANGAITAPVKQGVFAMHVAGSGDALAQADVFQPVYLVDDQTVGKTDGGATARSLAGIFLGFAPNGTDAFVFICGQLNAMILAATRVSRSGETVDTIASGAPSTTDLSLWSISGTVVVGPLADGTRLGQRKRFVVVASGGTPVGSITVTTPRGFATISAVSGLGSFFEFMWTATGWVLIASRGGTIA